MYRLFTQATRAISLGLHYYCQSTVELMLLLWLSVLELLSVNSDTARYAVTADEETIQPSTPFQSLRNNHTVQSQTRTMTSNFQ